MKMNPMVVGACALLLGAGSVWAELPRLDELEATVAKQKAVLADPKAGTQARVAAQLKLYEIDILTGPDTTYAAKRKELEAYLTHPIDGFNPAQQIDFLKQLYRQRLSVKLPSSYELAESFVKNLGAEAAKYEATMKAYRIESLRSQVDTLAKETSHEARLGLIDEALKDPVMSDRRLWLAMRRFEALADLGRDGDAEAYGLSLQAAATNRVEKLEYAQMLGDFYRMCAKRYCSASDPTLLHKAADQYRRHMTVAGDAGIAQRDLQKIAGCLKDAGDAKGAGVALDEAAAVLPKLAERQRKGAEREIAMMRGDLAFDAGDFAGALVAWNPYAQSLISEGGRDGSKLERYCRALKATGRKAEMLPFMRALAKRGNKYTRRRYEYLYESLKAEQPSAAAQ